MGQTTENRIRQAGMLNLGNTGYMEVILLTLYHCAEFRDCILSLDFDNMEARDNAETFQMVKELQVIFQKWNNLENVLPKAEDPDGVIKHDVLRLVYSHINPYIGPIGHVDPTEFVNVTRKCMRLRFPVDDPNDAHNFYSVLVRKLRYFFEMEGVPNKSRWTFRRIFVTPQTTLKQCFECHLVLSECPSPDNGGVVPYCFDCPVSPGQDSRVERTNHVAPLLIQALRDGDGGFGLHPRCYCSQNEPVMARVSRRPICNSLPTLLTVRFKRWPVCNRNTYFEFDEFLDLTELLGREEQESEVLMYRLLSAVVHHGNSNGLGRYFSFVRCNGGQQWARFWGTDVRPVDWQTVQKEAFGRQEADDYNYNDGIPTSEATNIGYMLYYEKIPQPS